MDVFGGYALPEKFKLASRKCHLLVRFYPIQYSGLYNSIPVHPAAPNRKKAPTPCATNETKLWLSEVRLNNVCDAGCYTQEHVQECLVKRAKGPHYEIALMFTSRSSSI